MYTIMPDVKWKRGILWTLVHLGLKGGVSADDYDSAYRDPVKWDLLDLFTIKKLPYQTGIKASRENYCGEVRLVHVPNEHIYTSAQRIMRGVNMTSKAFHEGLSLGSKRKKGALPGSFIT